MMGAGARNAPASKNLYISKCFFCLDFLCKSCETGGRPFDQIEQELAGGMKKTGGSQRRIWNKFWKNNSARNYSDPYVSRQRLNEV